MTNDMWIKNEKEKPIEKVCEHDVCSTCKHMIEKGSGQTVTTWGYGMQREIFCELHKKPYDQVRLLINIDQPTEYWFSRIVTKRVNEDGSDYKTKN